MSKFPTRREWSILGASAAYCAFVAFILCFLWLAFKDMTGDYIVGTTDLSPQTANAIAETPINWPLLWQGALVGMALGLVIGLIILTRKRLST